MNNNVDNNNPLPSSHNDNTTEEQYMNYQHQTTIDYSQILSSPGHHSITSSSSRSSSSSHSSSQNENGNSRRRRRHSSGSTSNYSTSSSLPYHQQQSTNNNNKNKNTSSSSSSSHSILQQYGTPTLLYRHLPSYDYNNPSSYPHHHQQQPWSRTLIHPYYHPHYDALYINRHLRRQTLSSSSSDVVVEYQPSLNALRECLTPAEATAGEIYIPGELNVRRAVRPSDYRRGKYYKNWVSRKMAKEEALLHYGNCLAIVGNDDDDDDASSQSQSHVVHPMGDDLSCVGITPLLQYPWSSSSNDDDNIHHPNNGDNSGCCGTSLDLSHRILQIHPFSNSNRLVAVRSTHTISILHHQHHDLEERLRLSLPSTLDISCHVKYPTFTIVSSNNNNSSSSSKKGTLLHNVSLSPSTCDYYDDEPLIPSYRYPSIETTMVEYSPHHFQILYTASRPLNRRHTSLHLIDYRSKTTITTTTTSRPLLLWSPSRSCHFGDAYDITAIRPSRVNDYVLHVATTNRSVVELDVRMLRDVVVRVCYGVSGLGEGMYADKQPPQEEEEEGGNNGMSLPPPVADYLVDCSKTDGNDKCRDRLLFTIFGGRNAHALHVHIPPDEPTLYETLPIETGIVDNNNDDETSSSSVGVPATATTARTLSIPLIDANRFVKTIGLAVKNVYWFGRRRRRKCYCVLVLTDKGDIYAYTIGEAGGGGEAGDDDDDWGGGSRGNGGVVRIPDKFIPRNIIPTGRITDNNNEMNNNNNNNNPLSSTSSTHHHSPMYYHLSNRHPAPHFIIKSQQQQQQTSSSTTTTTNKTTTTTTTTQPCRYTPIPTVKRDYHTITHQLVDEVIKGGYDKRFQSKKKKKKKKVVEDKCDIIEYDDNDNVDDDDSINGMTPNDHNNDDTTRGLLTTTTTTHMVSVRHVVANPSMIVSLPHERKNNNKNATRTISSSPKQKRQRHDKDDDSDDDNDNDNNTISIPHSHSLLKQHYNTFVKKQQQQMSRQQRASQESSRYSIPPNEENNDDDDVCRSDVNDDMIAVFDELWEKEEEEEEKEEDDFG